jgi:hypothetical protein
MLEGTKRIGYGRLRFQKSGIAETAPSAESLRRCTYDLTDIVDVSIDFQLPVETQHEYGGYAKGFPSLFTTAARIRCFDFEDLWEL